jgi:hypothetical protein
MRKLSISQAWDETRVVLARDGKLIGAVALAMLVFPGLVLNAIVPAAPRGEMPAPGAWIIVGLIALVISFIGQLSIVRLAMGPQITVGQAIVHGARRTLPFVAAFLIWAVPFALLVSLLYETARTNVPNISAIAALGMIAVCIVGLFFAIRLLLLGPVASAEPLGPLDIFRRSWELTAGNWWRLFGFLLVFFIGAVVLLWATASVVGLIARMIFGDITPLSPGWLVVMIIAQVLSASIYVVLFTMQARLYVQRSRTPGAEASVPTTGI